tara:strand:+ start:93 stop:587 length:495 start_codon:yes stop_codon:yes gene_type:complete
MSQEKITINEALRDSIFSIMINKSLTVSVAESCTGGFLSTFFTSGSGSSALFKGSMVTYSNESKTDFLDISPALINKYGVVSKAVVEQMAYSIRKKYNTNYGLATTGYVELSNQRLVEEELHAWISIASSDYIISKRLILNKNRLSNITHISDILLNLFRKEII